MKRIIINIIFAFIHIVSFTQSSDTTLNEKCFVQLKNGNKIYGCNVYVRSQKTFSLHSDFVIQDYGIDKFFFNDTNVVAYQDDRGFYYAYVGKEMIGSRAFAKRVFASSEDFPFSPSSV